MQQNIQLSEFEVDGLFGRYRHQIKFPVSKPDEPQPSLVILHGPNGVGKTTVLRMIDGFMRLDFAAFRENPFKTAALRFTNGSSVDVRPTFKGNRKTSLEVTFENQSVSLHPAHPGALKEEDIPKVEAFREKFHKFREPLVFEFIDTSRIVRQRPPDDEDAPSARMLRQYMMLRERELVKPVSKRSTRCTSLALKLPA